MIDRPHTPTTSPVPGCFGHEKTPQPLVQRRVRLGQHQPQLGGVADESPRWPGHRPRARSGSIATVGRVGRSGGSGHAWIVSPTRRGPIARSPSSGEPRSNEQRSACSRSSGDRRGHGGSQGRHEAKATPPTLADATARHASSLLRVLFDLLPSVDERSDCSSTLSNPQEREHVERDRAQRRMAQRDSFTAQRAESFIAWYG